MYCFFPFSDNYSHIFSVAVIIIVFSFFFGMMGIYNRELYTSFKGNETCRDVIVDIRSQFLEFLQTSNDWVKNIDRKWKVVS